MLELNIDFANLNSLSSLEKIDKLFIEFLQNHDKNLYLGLSNARDSQFLNDQEYSDLIVTIAPYLEDFIAKIFHIESDLFSLRQLNLQFNSVYECRRKFIQRHVIKKFNIEDAKSFDMQKISQNLERLIGKFTQEGLAKNILAWLDDSDKFVEELDLAARYCAFMYYNNSSLALFNLPRSIDSQNWVSNVKVEQIAKDQTLNYDYRDHEKTIVNSMMHANYCIYCHKQKKDSCSKGLKKLQPQKYNGETKDGCPLEQKISEMNLLKRDGYNIAALATIIIDNPLVAATGHRICNDCMKGCIFQKQDPVNVPLVESEILDEVLSLPWGAEIYILLTKWNPLKIRSYLPKKSNNYNILVTGLGPAGFSLAYYLLHEGNNIVAIDGLKIQPLDAKFLKPIKHWKSVIEKLSERKPDGFGGVAEYGITHRWDKNNLKLIRMMLERMNNFEMQSSLRLGSNITIEEAFKMGFDHIALALGAGEPKFIAQNDYFAKNIGSAASFLMSLNQEGSYLKDSKSKLRVQLPVVIIGCGLTAIDSAVEIMQFYPVMVENILREYENNQLDRRNKDEDVSIIQKYIRHARELRLTKSVDDRVRLIQEFGGVKIIYRQAITKSPAYQLNHEEIAHARAIGVEFLENLEIQEFHKDSDDYIKRVTLNNGESIDVGQVFLAIGTKKNDFFDLRGLAQNPIDDIFKMMGNRISHFGDCNSKYEGSVVNAIASVKNNYHKIIHTLSKTKPKTLKENMISYQSYVLKNKKIGNDICKLTILAPKIVEKYTLGRFFRLQNYDNNSKPIALTPIETNKNKGLITFLVDVGKETSEYISALKENDIIALMGPTGTELKLPKSKTIILISEGIANASLGMIARIYRDLGSKVIIIANAIDEKEIIYRKELSDTADHLIWVGDLINTDLKKNEIIAKNFENAFTIVCDLNIEKTNISIYLNLNEELLSKIFNLCQEYLPKASIVKAIYARMHCMMKGICGKCIKPSSDRKDYIFACQENHEIL